ncbi:M48 metallopeptidase family protein [Dyella japonica]|uniref:Metal-dependent hydrolase n=1 Tax=Dyella japonica DSM 16301 TaxID=1440762 RepID=A0A0G9H4V5_9GAMM|nr:YgjP-like metallopeptidase domain-containing protein [Dyella japonica]KLD64239.1 metal-dependent hydrolase [Dyella japonica DSM 16301]
MTTLKYLGGYPPALLDKVRQLIARDELGTYLEQRHPGRHEVQSDKALYAYTNALRQEHLRNAPGIDRVWYDSKLDVISKALGMHTAISHVHGARMKARKEIRIASLFRDTPPEFLKMIVVHELAHLKETEHNKAFYQLCEYMQPDYHQQELDLRLLLTWRDALEARTPR